MKDHKFRLVLEMTSVFYLQPPVCFSFFTKWQHVIRIGQLDPESACISQFAGFS
jgi:hypothetical protein